MEATKITQHGKIYFHTPTHAIETQEALQRAGLRHVGSKPDRINENAIGLHWGDGLYFTTDRIDVYQRYPGPQYSKLEFQPIPQALDNLKEGHQTQKALRAGLIAEITPLVVEAMDEALKRFPEMARKRKVNELKRRDGWKFFVSELKKKRDKYVLAHIRLIIKKEFPGITQIYESTFSNYFRNEQ